MLRLIVFIPLFLFGAMLSDAEGIGQKYAKEVAKRPPPSEASQAAALIDATSAWLSIDLEQLRIPPRQTALEILSDDSFLKHLQDIGFDGLHLKNLKEGGSARTGFRIDPKWGDQWQKLKNGSNAAQMTLVGDLIGAATGVGTDFELALQNISDYPELYHLIEIEKKDWKSLPKIPVGTQNANVPWLSLDDLYNKGYIPEAAQPYTKESAWNATGKIRCADGVERRWIYLKEGQNNPLLSWLSFSFSADRIASADALDWIYRLGPNVLTIDAKLPLHAKETEALWIRKIGGFTVGATNGTLSDLKASPTDVAIDVPTRPALLHALITEDANALRLIYQLYLHAQIPSIRLVHALEPFASSPCDWTEFLENPKRHYLYKEEKVTGEILRERLLKEDLFRLNAESRDNIPISTWGGYCAMSLAPAKGEKFEKHQEEIQKAHLLTAFAYAMQPGIFSLSASDLLGMLSLAPFSLSDPNPGALYPSLPCQMQTPRSFASQLKKILAVRSSSKIAKGELIGILPVQNKGTLVLLHRLPESRFFHLLALNFSKSPVQENVRISGIQDTWAIDLMTGLSQEKGFEAETFFFDLPPLSGKVFLFQPKYYD